MSAAIPAVSANTPKALRDAWHALTAEKRLRIRDAAHTLGVSEAELLATGVGEHVTRLAGDLRDLMMRMGELGPVMALTRNEAAVHEKEGVYQNITHGDQIGLVLARRSTCACSTTSGRSVMPSRSGSAATPATRSSSSTPAATPSTKSTCARAPTRSPSRRCATPGRHLSRSPAKPCCRTRQEARRNAPTKPSMWKHCAPAGDP